MATSSHKLTRAIKLSGNLQRLLILIIINFSFGIKIDVIVSAMTIISSIVVSVVAIAIVPIISIVSVIAIVSVVAIITTITAVIVVPVIVVMVPIVTHDEKLGATLDSDT